MGERATRSRKPAKEAAQDDDDQNIVFDRILVTTVATEISKKGLIQWQGLWKAAEKGAVCRSFFPVLEQRLKMKTPITPIVTGHGKTESTYTSLN